MVIARYRWCVRHAPPIETIDINNLSRHLSRVVYLVLYGVVGFREIMAFANSVLHGGVVDYELFGERLRHGPDDLVFDPAVGE